MLMLNALIYLIIISLAKADFTVSDSMPACKGFTISNSGSENKFGYAVDGGGDFNGDGIPDIVIAGYNEPNPTSVYVIYGRDDGYSDIDVATMTSTDGFKITGFGITNIDNSNYITLAGDIDDDDLADLVIGAVTQDSGVGAGYVIYGKQGGYTDFDISSLTPAMGAKISGAAGWNVNTRGDIDGDGIKDLVFTSSGADATFGAIYVIYGSTTRLTSFSIGSLASPVGFKISAFTNAYIGAAFASAGDFDGDGIDDFTFSAPGALTDQGVAYVIYGKDTVNWADFSVSTSSAAGRFTVTGTSSIYKLCLVASDAGDFNNDGYSDIIWGSPPTSSNQGNVVLIYGANGGPADFGISSITSTQGLKVIGASTGDYLGSSLSSLEDLSGDGITEVLVGSKGASGKGIVYVIYGRDDEPVSINIASLSDSQGLKIIGSTSGSLFGQSARDIGDINGDGVPDIAIGAPGTGTTGKVYVVFGVNAWACNTCDTFKTCQTCETGYDYTWNGVCYKDCPTHAPYKLNMECFSEDPTPPPDLARGDITLSDTVPACKGFTITNSAAGNKQFAYAVNGGGDFNGDQIPDIVISDYQYPSPSTVYVIYGRDDGYTNIDVNTMSATDGFKITGLEISCDDNSNFISLAGDVDDDGKADLVIAASQANSGAGAVYVVYGDIGYTNFDISTPPSMVVQINGAGGWNVNTRADINGDEIADIIISSKGADSNYGAIYVFYGSQTRALTTFDFKISGFTSAYLGTALASAGDFNGDDIDDFVFTAPGALSNQGRGYVLYGNENPFSNFAVTSIGVADGFTLDGASPTILGCVVSDAGDYNGDGAADILFGSPQINTNQGHVLLIYGADGGPADFSVSGMTASQGIKLTGVSMRDLLGSSLSSLKDMNGDGITEILVGAPGYSYNKGVMYLLFGRDDDPSTIDLDAFTAADGFKILGSAADSLLGSSVRDIGDVNGDGVADFIIGAPGTGSTGKAHVVFGANAWACDTCSTFKACQACKPGYDYTWNGVCYQDCPAHAPYKLNWECFSEDPTPPPDSTRGDITLSDPLPSCKGFVISNSATNTQFAYAVDGGGDFNGDGVPDIIISDYQHPNPSTVSVVYGKESGYASIDVATMTSQEGFQITGLQIEADDNSNFITMSGDLDKDGKADLVIGASQADSGAGAVYVIYGGTGYIDFPISSLPSAAAKISGAGGWNVNTRADINGDEIADIIIGSKTADSNNGAVYVIYGSQTRLTSFNIASLTSAVGFKISGFPTASLGAALASAGDFNEDEIDDFTFAAPGALSDQGVFYVVYGKDTPPFSDFSVTTSGAAGRFTVTGASSIDNLCLVTSDAGDFNGDGASDILCSSPSTNTDQGAVLLVYGGSADFAVSAMAASQGIKLTGVSLRDLLGSSLSSLQDINGDGISDILVGAKGYSYNKGAVYLLFGRNDQPSTIDLDAFTATDGFKILGSTLDGLLGASMRDLRDINGDGVSDIIIGAPGTGSDGKAYVLFGPNAWGCDTCDTSTTTCQTCKPGYDYTWNGLCYKECPVHAPYRLDWECFSEDPTPLPDSTRGDITLSDSLDSCQGFSILNSAANTQFGYAVSGGGDFNGDKILDIVISTYEDPNPSTLYVIYGKINGYGNIDVATMTAQEGFKITGLEIKNDDNSNFISLDGDIDQDGLSDLVIGASLADSGAGAVYVIYGGLGYTDFDISTLPTTGVKISGAGGWNVNTKTDINGDKISDVVISSKEADSNNGAIYVIYGSQTRLSSFNIASLTSAVGFKISGFPTAYLGAALSSAGDFNGDRIADLTISAPGALSDQGVGYVIYGKQTPATFSDFSVSTSGATGRFTVTGSSSIDQLFLVASDAGDFNNDGYSDVLWASPTTNTDQGTILLIYGGSTDFGVSSMAASQGIKLTGVSLRDLLGSSLASLPDVNGDGINEILIGAKGYSYNKGALYLLYGRKDKPPTINLDTFTAADGFKILGSTPDGLLGASVESIGDLNGDGVSDILIGAPGTGNTGRAYVVFGPNAWSCSTCSSTSKKCQTCKSGYDYTYNGMCYKKCPINTPFELNHECFTTDPTPKPPSIIQPTLKSSVATSAITTYATNKVMNFWSPADALPFLYGQLKTSITYMRFLNVSRSDKLEEMFLLYADSDTNVIPWVGMPDSIQDSFPNYELPYMFQKYEVLSSFLANFGDDFTCLTIVLILFTVVKIALTILKKWMRNLPTVKHLLQKASNTLQNFFVGAFAEALGPIVFYTTMEFKNSTKGEEGYSVLSPLACYLCILLGISIMILNLWIVQKFQGVKKKTTPENPHQKEDYEYKVLEKKYEGFSVLYEEFDNDSLGQQAAFLFFNLRAVIESFIIGVLFDSPMAQVILLMLVNLVFLAYIAIKKPFDSKLDVVQQFSLLLIIFTCNCCFIHLAHSDHDVHNTSEVVFYLLVIFQFVPLLFFAINMVQTLVETYRFLRAHLFAKKKKQLQNTSKLNEKSHNSSSIFPFDHSSSLKTSAFEVVVSNERLLTTDPSNRPNKEAFQQGLEEPRKPPSAGKSGRVHSRKRRIVAAGSGFWEAGIETVDQRNQSKDQINKPETAEKPYSSTIESSKKRLQRRKSNGDSRVEEGEPSNSDISLETLLNPLPITSQDEIKPVLMDPVQAEPLKNNLADRMFTIESRHKRIQSDLVKLKLNSKDGSPSFEMNLENPIIEKAEIKRPQIEPERINLGQVIHRLKTNKRRIQQE